MEARKEKLKNILDKNGISSLPSFYALAPGRVNIIGEHIDYCGYAVLPMAIQQDILIAVVTDDSKRLKLYNSDPLFEPLVSDINDLNIDPTKVKWYNYVKCGIRGIMEHFKIEMPIGMTLAIDGSVPRSAGLSSSSALVCASALATLHANDLELDKVELANLCASCEKYVGTQGGGMDQAISFLAQEGKAKLIEFNPLRDTDIEIPKGVSFVIINSCVESNKAASSHFNERVVECRIATQILAKLGGLQWREYRKLGDVHKALNLTLKEMIAKVDQHFKKEKYLRSEVCKILDLDDEQFISECLTANTTDMQFFQLHARAKHVYEEANRVYEFKNVCDNLEEGSIEVLGKLMNKSHDSLRDQYDCSHPDLDELVTICRGAGALGSRLTGAGWGGCTVSLVEEDKTEKFIKEVGNKYFNADKRRSALLDSSIFVSKSAPGARIL